MKPTRAFAAVLFVVLIAVASAVPARAGAPRTHDGFFLRLSGGFGYAGSSIDDAGETFKISGATGDVNFAIGGMVSPNFAIHGTIMGFAVTDPTLEWENVGSGTFNGDVSLAAWGGGVTYYIMPANLYLTGSIGVGTVTVDVDGGPSFDSDTGVVVDLGLGKEWWVGDSWGLGIAGGVMLHSIPDGGIDENWTGASLGLRFSATYN
jgi:hypothetical protein